MGIKKKLLSFAWAFATTEWVGGTEVIKCVEYFNLAWENYKI